MGTLIAPGIEPVLLTVDEACAALHCGRSFFYGLRRTGAIKTVTLGRSTRVPVREIREFADRLEAVS